MKYTYEAEFEIKLRSLSDSIAKVEDNLNESLAEVGLRKKINFSSKFITAIVSTGRPLSDEEEYKMKTLLESQMIERMPKYDIRLSSFSCKSGNVQQSVEQSVE